MKNIAVIGAGTMGNGIAHVFAQNGFKNKRHKPLGTFPLPTALKQVLQTQS
jgi:3-hydroxyacyl-CoA dehydrogenase